MTTAAPAFETTRRKLILMLSMHPSAAGRQWASWVVTLMLMLVQTLLRT